jgi:hypothetical protein
MTVLRRDRDIFASCNMGSTGIAPVLQIGSEIQVGHLLANFTHYCRRLRRAGAASSQIQPLFGWVIR